MTTGRINQVTILDPQAPWGARGRPTREGGLELLLGRSAPEDALGQGHPARRTRGAAGDHSIAPTEFPKRQSAAGGNRAKRPPYAAACAPQVEVTRPQSRPGAVIGWSMPPRI